VTPLQLPTLDGDGVRLRAFRSGDAAAVVAAGRDPLIPLISTVPAGCDEIAARAFIERQWGRAETGAGYSFAISRLDGDEAVGQLGVWLRDVDRGRVVVGYWVTPAARGQGVAARALEVACAWALSDLGAARIEVHIEPGNAASLRTAERVGFRREGLMRDFEEIGGERRDLMMLSLLPSDRADRR